MAAGAFDYTFLTSTRDVGLVRVTVAYADADPVPVPVSSLVPGEVLRLDLLRVLNAWIEPRQKRYIASYRPREDALDPDENKLMGQVDANRIEFDEFVDSPQVQDVLSNGFELGNEVQANNTVREFSVVSGLDVVTKTPATAMSVRETVRISTAKIKYVGDAYHDQISEILYNGFVDGTSTKNMAKLLQGRNSVLNSRAEFIARNEMGNMYAKLTEIRQTENGVVSYIWRTSEDERVRPSHAIKNGQVFQWDDPPPDTGNPGADYNCRCYAEPVLDSIDPEITGQVGSPGEPAIGVEAVEAMTMKTPTPIVEPVETFSAFVEINSREEMNAFKRSLKELKFQKNARYVSKKEAAEEGGAWGFHLTDLTDDQMNKINSKRWRDKTGYSKGFNLYPDTEWKPPKESFGIFPTSLDALEEIKTLGGSTGAKLVRDPETGTQFVLKRGKNPAHIQEEFLTNEMYRALGTKVPDSRLYNGDTMLSEYIEGTAFSKLKGADRVRAQLHAQGDFVQDALLGNWDVAGLDLDNLLVDKSGNVWRIDNGAGLRFRAQGAPKGDAFDEWNTELWTLRDATKNKSAAEVFEHVEWNEYLEKNIENALRKRSEVMALIEDASLKRTMAARFDNLEEVLALSKEMRSDGWDNSYVDMFSKQRAAMGKSGMRERMPEELTPVGSTRKGRGAGPDQEWSPNEMLQSRSESSNMKSIPAVRDEDGKLWDDLRGKDGIMRRYFDHLDTVAEGNKKYSEELAQIHMKWAEDQAESSWDPRAQGMKAWLTNKRGADDSNIWWRDGKRDAERHLEEFIEELPDPKEYGISKTKEQLFDETMSSFHAMNYDVLKKADLPTKSADNSKLLVVRTEDSSVLRRQDMNALGAEGEIQRGAAESASMFRTFYYKGDNAVWNEVPLHRVVASYLPDRGGAAFNAKYGGSMRQKYMFAGDDENEIVVFFGDSKSKVMAKTLTQRGQDEWNKLEASDWAGGVTPKAKKAPLPRDVTFAKPASGSPKIPTSGKLDPVEVDWGGINPKIITFSEDAGVDLSKVKISNPVLLEKMKEGWYVTEIVEDILLVQPMGMKPPAYIPKHLWSPGEPWKNFKLMAEYNPKADS
jgi:SPP1 gp7 family putative phage head morphogenesis protein